MKIRNPETNTLENVEIKKSSKPGTDYYVVVINNEEYDSRELLMMEYEIVQIELEETKKFNDFLELVRFHLWETEEYFQGKIDMAQEMFNKKEGGENEKGV